MSTNENKDLTIGGNFSLTNTVSETGISLAQEDIVIPPLKIQQPTSGGDYKPGSFVYALTKESYDTINCIFFKNTLGRVNFNPDRGAQQKVLCGSSNRIKPSAIVANPYATNCAECKFARPGFFEEVKIGNEIRKQQCDMTIPIIGMFADSYNFFVWSARRTSRTIMGQFLTQTAMSISLINQVKKTKLALHNYIVTLSTKEALSQGNKYYIPQIIGTKQIDTADYGEFFSTVKDYNFDRVLEEDIDEPIMDTEKII